MVNIEKYKNDGWGLSKKCFLDIENILNNFSEPNIIEFGSGVSTEFFVDYLNENNLNGQIYSFDDNLEYSTKIVDDSLKLKILDLIECDDKSLDLMFKNKNYSRELFKIKSTPTNTRQKNTFYDIKVEMLPENIDLVILDGPHGNGRSIGFLHLINRLKKGSVVIIDDYTHYDFSERFKQIFPNSELIIQSNSGSKNQWEMGGDYRIYKIQ